MKKPSSGWDIALNNVAKRPSQNARRQKATLPKSISEKAFRNGLDQAYRAVGNRAFEILCERLFIDKRKASGFLPVTPDGQPTFIKQDEAELAARIAIEIETLAKAGFLNALGNKEVREFIIDSAFRGRQKKIRTSRVSTVLAEAKRTYPDLSVKDRIREMEKRGVLRQIGDRWELVETGDQLPRAINSAFSRLK